MSFLSIYSGSACAWLISSINRESMCELQVTVPKALSVLFYPIIQPQTVRLGSLFLRIYSALATVFFTVLYILKMPNIQELNILAFTEFLLFSGIAELCLWGFYGAQEKKLWRVWVAIVLIIIGILGMMVIFNAFY